MINSKDEIMIKFAADISGIDPDRFPETIKELEMQDDQEQHIDPLRFPGTVRELERQTKPEDYIDPTRFPGTIRELEGLEPVDEPSKSRPLSRRDFSGRLEDTKEEFGLHPEEYPYGEDWPPDPMWQDPPVGSPVYVAMNNPQQYLKGYEKPYRGYVRDRSFDKVTKVVMDRLVANNPENFFKWGLRRVSDLEPWMIPAAKSLIDKDPQLALDISLYKQGPAIVKSGLLTRLWRNAMKSDLANDMFPGSYSRHMQSLAGEIARTDPEFYKTYIIGDIDDETFDNMSDEDMMVAHKGNTLSKRKFRKQDLARFNNWAIDAMRNK